MPELIRNSPWSGTNHKWIRSSHGVHESPTGTPDASTFTEATHYPKGYLPEGTPVDASDLAKLKPYVAPAPGEPAVNLGFLLSPSRVVGGAATPVAVLRHGTVGVSDLNALNITFEAPAFAPGFIFED